MREFMINFAVDDLDAFVARLTAKGLLKRGFISVHHVHSRKTSDIE